MKYSAFLLFFYCSVFALAQSGASGSKPPGITVTAAVVSRTCAPVFTDYKAVPETDFLTTDPHACILFRYSNGNKGDKIRFEWINPLHTIMQTYDGVAQTDGDRSWWIYLAIKDKPPSFAPGEWHIRVFYNDAGIVDLPFRISTPPPGRLEMISSTGLPNGTAGAPYQYRFTLRGGDPPYHWTAPEGLPRDLSLSSDGVVTGTPAQRGGYAFVIAAQDRAGNKITRTVSLGVTAPPAVHAGSRVLTITRSAACGQGNGVMSVDRRQPDLWLDFSITGGKQDDPVGVEWLDPNGEVIHRTSFTYKNTAETCFQQDFAIAKEQNAQPGEWRVRVIWNNSETFSLPFRVTESEVTREMQDKLLSGRLALLIGNAEYKHLAPIPSAAGDIDLLGAALQRDGFDVTRKSNLTVEEWRRAEREFMSKVQKDSVVVVYYSGYGLHDGDENWLVPVGFDPADSGPLATRVYSVLRLRQLLEAKQAKLKIFFLNAGRAASDLQSQSQKAGLAAPETDRQTVIGLALPPGRTEAVQVNEKTSPFARMLAGILQRPNVALDGLGAELRREAEAVPGAPVPVVFMDNPEQFSFVPKKVFVPPAAQPRLPVDATLLVQPDSGASATNVTQLGDPLSKVTGPGSGPRVASRAHSGLFASAYKIGGGVSAPVPIYKPEPEYSEAARKAGFQGTVVLLVVIDAQGNVADALTIRPLGLGLDEKAIEAVKKWKFRPGTKDGKPISVQATIEVNFRSDFPRQTAILPIPNENATIKEEQLPPPATPVGRWMIRDARFELVPGALGPRLLTASLNDFPKPPYAASIDVSLEIDAEGHPQSVQAQAPPPFDAAAIASAVRQWTFSPARQAGKAIAVHGSLKLSYEFSAGVVGGVPGGVPSSGAGGLDMLPRATSPSRIRVGGNVQAANLIRQVAPAYPALAKQARVQGTVTFTSVIGKDGTIHELQLVSGNPLLVPAAEEAVKQWQYKPTLLNGEPVEVITTIEVNFTLSSDNAAGSAATTSFTFDYKFQPKPGLRRWRKVDASTWEELYDDGSRTLFHVVGSAELDGDAGVIVRRMDSSHYESTPRKGALEVFIPNKNSRRLWARFRSFDENWGSWGNLGEMHDIN